MRLRSHVSLGMFLGSFCLLSLAGLLLQGHFAAIKEMREYALPLASELPPLERKLAMLAEHVELAELQASTRSDTSQQQLDAYVLPRGNDAKRLLAFFESMQTILERRKILRNMDPITIGSSEPARIEGQSQGSRRLTRRAIRLSVDVRPEGRATLQSILGLSGMLTVGDLLSEQNVSDLFVATETARHSAIVPMEQFLSSDLLTYIRDSRLPNERLAQALSSEELSSRFQKILAESRLPAVRELLTGDIGRTLIAQKLWPVQFIIPVQERVQILGDGWERVELTLQAYGSES